MSTVQQALLKKITIKVVCGEIKKPTVETPLMRVYGQATGFKPVSSQYGETSRFLGQFKAINAATGETFEAPECFLPKVVESLLEGALMDEKAGSVQFAFDVYVTPANNAFGYEYRVRPVIKPVESPVMAALEAEMGKIALPAPGKIGAKK